ncbi:MAG: hypothetical protein WKG07_34985 [Hymenobacter sp.]
MLMGSYGRGGTGKNGPASTLDQGRVSPCRPASGKCIVLPARRRQRPPAHHRRPGPRGGHRHAQRQQRQPDVDAVPDVGG